MKLKFTTVIKLVLSKVIQYFEVRNRNYLTRLLNPVTQRKILPENKQVRTCGNLKQLQAMLQNYLHNCFHLVRFGLHNDLGIFGACPDKRLHLISLGWFKYCLQGFTAQAGGPKSLALQQYDKFCASIGKKLSRHGDCDLPRMNFPKGFSSGDKLIGHEVTWCLLVKLFALRTTRFRQILVPKAKVKKLMKTSKKFQMHHCKQHWAMTPT